MVDPNKPRERDAFSGVETTQHEWDGIKELNNPAPRTWLWILYLSIIFSVGYWVVYPAWPTPGGNTRGSFGWTQHKELAAAQQEITDMRARHMGRRSIRFICCIQNISPAKLVQGGISLAHCIAQRRLQRRLLQFLSGLPLLHQEKHRDFR